MREESETGAFNAIPVPLLQEVYIQRYGGVIEEV
jgi:hypothetical protein